jgi:hypothetical protein
MRERKDEEEEGRRGKRRRGGKKREEKTIPPTFDSKSLFQTQLGQSQAHQKLFCHQHSYQTHQIKMQCPFLTINNLIY